MVTEKNWQIMYTSSREQAIQMRLSSKGVSILATRILEIIIPRMYSAVYSTALPNKTGNSNCGLTCIVCVIYNVTAMEPCPTGLKFVSDPLTTPPLS